MQLRDARRRVWPGGLAENAVTVRTQNAVLILWLNYELTDEFFGMKRDIAAGAGPAPYPGLRRRPRQEARRADRHQV
jgi:hypothetical protein